MHLGVSFCLQLSAGETACERSAQHDVAVALPSAALFGIGSWGCYSHGVVAVKKVV